jgi:hypothetical protein
VEAAAMNQFGDFFRVQLEKHFAVFIVGLLAIVVGGFWIAARLV